MGHIGRQALHLKRAQVLQQDAILRFDSRRLAYEYYRDLQPYLLRHLHLIEVYVEQVAVKGVALDVAYDHHSRVLLPIHFELQKAALASRCDRVLQVGRVHLQSSGSNVVPVKVGRRDGLTPQKPDLLAEYLPLVG